VQEIFVNARERVRQALLCRKPDQIPKALGFFDQSLEAIAPTRPENYFNLVDIGINVINPVQPDCMDAVAIKREFGDKLAIWGSVGSSRLWDWGTPAQVRAEVRHRIEDLGPEGLLLAPAYDIDYAPFDNIVAFVEAVEEFGRI
jgi:uroporphyrinogen-III decarboxylase